MDVENKNNNENAESVNADAEFVLKLTRTELEHLAYLWAKDFVHGRYFYDFLCAYGDPWEEFLDAQLHNKFADSLGTAAVVQLIEFANEELAIDQRTSDVFKKGDAAEWWAVREENSHHPNNPNSVGGGTCSCSKTIIRHDRNWEWIEEEIRLHRAGKCRERVNGLFQWAVSVS